MVSKKTTPVKKGAGKLKLKKETVRDLDPKGKAGGVKGGQRPQNPISAQCTHDMFCPTGVAC